MIGWLTGGAGEGARKENNGQWEGGNEGMITLKEITQGGNRKSCWDCFPPQSPLADETISCYRRNAKQQRNFLGSVVTIMIPTRLINYTLA